MKKVSIVGTAESWRETPFKDDTFKTWVINDMYDLVPSYDVLFDIHDIDFIKSYVSRGSKTFHYDNLKALDKTIYMQEEHDEIPAAIKYPLDEMIEKYGRYFTNSVSYMLALAMEQKFDVIHLYGVDMSVGGEYEEQRPSVEYFIGLARGKGIDVFISENSDLLKSSHLYGYEQKKADAFMAKCVRRMSFLNKQKAQTEKQIQGLTTLLNRTEGSIEDLKYTMTIY